jgi:hypothetical protein
MKLHTFVFLAYSVCGVLGMGEGTATRRGYGFVGYGIPVFDPPCAFACRDSIAGATLNCSMVEAMPGMEGMDMGGGTVMTDPACYATDDVFLQTLAWCVQSKCNEVPTWKLEKFWKDNVAGTFADQPDPKETYQQALAHISDTPSIEYAETGPLNQTSIVAEDLWIAAHNTDVVFAHQETMQEGFG